MSTPQDLPVDFVQRMRGQLGAEAGEFLAALAEPPRVSIRYNPAKSTSATWKGTPIPWCPEGRYLPERPAFVQDPWWHAGVYYVQEAASMLLSEAVRLLVTDQQPVKALDLCAAPGGKSTLLAATLPEGSLLVANEVISGRANTLYENMIKWGHPNTLVSRSDPQLFKELNGFFDLVVVDAPCSGEGLFRKDLQARKEWSLQHVQHCARRQKRILADAAETLSEGGWLIYCTCTYAPEENERNVQWLLEQGFEGVALPDRSAYGTRQVEITTSQGNASAWAAYPHRVGGEGFFLSALRKHAAGKFRHRKRAASTWKLPQVVRPALAPWVAQAADLAWNMDRHGLVYAIHPSLQQDRDALDQHVALKNHGLLVGRWNGKTLIPSHELAMSTLLHPDLPCLDLELEDALRYLRKDEVRPAGKPATGWTVVRYAGIPLGWVKVLADRINNYYPRTYRLRQAPSTTENHGS